MLDSTFYPPFHPLISLLIHMSPFHNNNPYFQDEFLSLAVDSPVYVRQLEQAGEGAAAWRCKFPKQIEEEK